jgi:hypothetical protein
VPAWQRGLVTPDDLLEGLSEVLRARVLAIEAAQVRVRKARP